MLSESIPHSPPPSQSISRLPPDAQYIFETTALRWASWIQSTVYFSDKYIHIIFVSMYTYPESSIPFRYSDKNFVYNLCFHTYVYVVRMLVFLFYTTVILPGEV
jgi:hypothetical protein